MISSKIKIILVPALVLSVATSALLAGAWSATGTITGSPHDLSANATLSSNTADNGEICVYCHTPHAANTDFVGAPLWNKATPGGTFTMYGATMGLTATGAATPTAAATEPSSPSLACLSCHDGVSSIDSIVNAPGSGMRAIAGTKNIVNGISPTYGGNIGGAPGVATTGNIILSNDHPVSITYTAGKASLRATNTVLTTVTGTAWVGASTIDHLLRSGKIECGSCHDPHNGYATQVSDTEVNFLRHTNNASKLCLGCHAK